MPVCELEHIMTLSFVLGGYKNIPSIILSIEPPVQICDSNSSYL